ncbi:DEAD/DEAH box helicase family protein [Staphylospora marina]|uniref:DEAD/DEAH box helicase family protein n=1 Tax=Staphylospora marina TaxID=2490858 RepID=UPI000F5C1B5A|nr:DEAD/DEAH box helicase family protein [Staphylospora marina]
MGIRLSTSGLYDQLIEAIHQSSSIYMLTSFILKSGAHLLAEPLRQASGRGADIKICTGDYLYVTSPDALEVLHAIPGVEFRLFRSGNRSFHPKAYLFRTHDNGLMIIGSSNLSASALKTGVEWNLSVDRDVDPAVFEKAMEAFMDVFHDDRTVDVNPETIREYKEEYASFHKIHPEVWPEEDPLVLSEEDPLPRHEITITPHEIQEEALQALSATREEGYDRALVVMATGLGKTYMSAFFAQRMEFRKVLFIAHQDEILRQAQATFTKVIPDRKTGLYNGYRKDRDADILFASIQTLSMKHHLERFHPDEFELVIIDEFHHAAAKTYQKVINHFRPRFLLGITATPDRLDGGNVYALCDNNVAYRIDFTEAIQRGFLSPFRYQGVYDEIDYRKIRYVNGQYDPYQWEQAFIQQEMAEKIFRKWLEFRQTRTLAFCGSIRQARYLSDHFNQRGFKTVALCGDHRTDRQEAIRQLEEGRIDVIFAVNLFNEGVDIPSVDTLLFVRPTQSMAVFLQQLGRGLRKAPGKEYCQVIDLIGNYRNLEMKLRLFGDLERKKGKTRFVASLPEACLFELDTRSIDLISRYDNDLPLRKRRLIQSYQDVKYRLGRRPTYLELHLHGWEDVRGYKSEWKSYAEFLEFMGELSPAESEAVNAYRELIRNVETTSMSRSYKMVLLKVMLDRGAQRWAEPISASEAAPSFYHWLEEVPYRKKKDILGNKELSLGYDEKKVARLIKHMPMTKWAGSANGLFLLEGDRFFASGYREIRSPELHAIIKEICEYRLHAYFEKGSPQES